MDVVVIPELVKLPLAVNGVPEERAIQIVSRNLVDIEIVDFLRQ